MLSEEQPTNGNRYRVKRRRVEPFIGFKRNSIVVIGYIGIGATHDPVWAIRCDCGNEFESDLKNDKLYDCGCGRGTEYLSLLKQNALARSNRRWYIKNIERNRLNSRRYYSERYKNDENFRKSEKARTYRKFKRRYKNDANFRELRRARARSRYRRGHRREYSRLWARRNAEKNHDKILAQRHARIAKSYGEKEFIDHRTLKRPRKKNQDLAGKRFGKITVLDYVSGNSWNVKCDCGRTYTLRSRDIRLELTKQCRYCKQRSIKNQVRVAKF